jgi:tRNA G18 (ribose-2'-O)-methylase SpoU
VQQLKAIERIMQAIEDCPLEQDQELIDNLTMLLDIYGGEQLITLSGLKQACREGGRTLREEIGKYYMAKGRICRDDQILVLKSDGIRKSDPVAKARAEKMVVILDNLRSVFNAGSIFRTGECLGIGEIVFCGSSPGPEHPHFAKTAMGTQDRLSWRRYLNTREAVIHYKEEGYKILALETAEGASSVFETGVDFPLALILGNEALGISREVLAEVDQIVALPVLGWKNSLNVGVAFAVAAYQMIFNRG